MRLTIIFALVTFLAGCTTPPALPPVQLAPNQHPKPPPITVVP